MRIRRIFLAVIALALAIRLPLTLGYYHGDMYNHFEWGAYPLEHGFNGMYEQPASFWRASKVNQPPGTIYILTTMHVIHRITYKGVLWWDANVALLPPDFLYNYQTQYLAALLKLPAVIADIGIGLLLYKFAKRYTNKKMALLSASVYLFTPLTFYNSAWWGQTDATVNFFGLLGLYYLVQKKLPFAYLAFATSLFIKASLLIFLPVIILITIKQRYPIKTVLLSILVPLLLALILSVPFHDFGDSLWLFRVYFGTVLFGTLNNVTVNAFNMWALIYGPYPNVRDDIMFLGWKAVYWGYVLFGTTLVAALVWLYKKFTLENVIRVLVITSFSSFLFLTGIHERYLFPIFPLFALLIAFYPKLLLLYAVTSVLHLLNMYHLWWSPTIDWIVHAMEKEKTVNFLIYGHIAVFLAFIYYGFTWSKQKAEHTIESF